MKKKNVAIIRPLVTEKTSVAQAQGRYTFLVRKASTKIDIKNAVREMYGVEAEEVKTMIQPSKVRLIGNKKEFKKRPLMKKAVVRLKGGKTIDPNKLKGTKETKEKESKKQS